MTECILVCVCVRARAICILNEATPTRRRSRNMQPGRHACLQGLTMAPRCVRTGVDDYATRVLGSVSNTSPDTKHGELVF